jgi:pyruvate dehydrogenase E1 component
LTSSPRFRQAEPAGTAPLIELPASGTAIHWALSAQELLLSRWGVHADVRSVTSWTEPRRDALDTDRALLRGEERVPCVTAAPADAPGPVPAVSDWMWQVPDQISQWVEQDYYSLGTDGFGLSDTRADVRRHFQVDAESIVVTALYRLVRTGQVAPETVARARARYGLDQ